MIEMLGSGNEARVDQRGDANNMSTVRQDGTDSRAHVDQFSANPTDQNENTSSIEQIGTGHLVEVSQGGVGNTNVSEIELGSSSNSVQIRQYEQFNDNYTRVEATGGRTIPSASPRAARETPVRQRSSSTAATTAWVSQH